MSFRTDTRCNVYPMAIMIKVHRLRVVNELDSESVEHHYMTTGDEDALQEIPANHLACESFWYDGEKTDRLSADIQLRTQRCSGHAVEW